MNIVHIKRYLALLPLMIGLPFAGALQATAEESPLERDLEQTELCLERASTTLPGNVRRGVGNEHAHIFAVCVGVISQSCQASYDEYRYWYGPGPEIHDCYDAEAQVWAALASNIYRRAEMLLSEEYGGGHHSLSHLDAARNSWRVESSPQCALLTGMQPDNASMRAAIRLECQRDYLAREAIFVFTWFEGVQAWTER